MKKFLALIFVFVAALGLAACGDKSEFKQDGEFTAFEVSIHDGAPMVTSVTVTVEKGKITKYFIDARQGSITQSSGEGESAVAASVKWNEKTKKELKFDYGMKDVGPKYEFKDGKWAVVDDAKCEKEWFEQAEAIEAKWLADGVESVEVNDGRISNVAGVTVKDGFYNKLAREAVENAKAGKVVVFKEALSYNGSADFYFVEVVFEKGKAKSVLIDTRQSKIEKATNDKGEEVDALVWNEKTKQELKEAYGMKDDGPKYEFKDGKWVEVEGEKSTLEWYEQVKLIQDFVVANGFAKKIVPIDGRSGAYEGDTAPIEALAGVTVVTGNYLELIAKAFAAIK